MVIKDNFLKNQENICFLLKNLHVHFVEKKYANKYHKTDTTSAMHVKESYTIKYVFALTSEY